MKPLKASDFRVPILAPDGKSILGFRPADLGQGGTTDKDKRAETRELLEIEILKERFKALRLENRPPPPVFVHDPERAVLEISTGAVVAVGVLLLVIVGMLCLIL